MKQPKLSPLVLAVLAACLGVAQADTAQAQAQAQAQTTSESMFAFSAFGTIGAVHSNEENADFVGSSNYQPKGAGRTHSWSTSVDSRVAGQVTATFTKEISAVVQILVEQQWDNTWSPVVEWLNVKYTFTPDLSVRLGRILLPTFMASESRKVGYTNPWVRPPVEVYSMIGVTSNDGVDATYGFRLGGVKNTVTALAGTADFTLINNVKGEQNPIYGITDLIEYGAFSVRIAYHTFKMQMPALAGYNFAGCSGCDVDASLRLSNIGATYDPGDWFVTGEWARLAVDKGSFQIGGVKSSGYLTAGYRFDRFVPYATYSRITQDVPPKFGASISQETTSAGLRWDFMKGTDLKLQLDRVRPGTGTGNLFVNKNGTQLGTATVFSAAVDFVF